MASLMPFHRTRKVHVAEVFVNDYEALAAELGLSTQVVLENTLRQYLAAAVDASPEIHQGGATVKSPFIATDIFETPRGYCALPLRQFEELERFAQGTDDDIEDVINDAVFQYLQHYASTWYAVERDRKERGAN